MTKYILNIIPQTHVRTTQGDSILFRIPRIKLHQSGLKRLERIERYNKYKLAVYAEALSQGFVMPSQGLSVKFFIPMPKTWRNWQREMMHMAIHQGKPDIDNLLKALFDSICKEDKHIGQLNELSKQWVDSEEGWIELIVGRKKYREHDFKIRPA